MEDLIFLDIETSSLDTSACEILELAFIRTNQYFEIQEMYQTFFRPETYIPNRVVELTGIKNEMVQAAPEFYELAEDLHSKLHGKRVIGHNISFDSKVLNRYFANLNIDIDFRTFCTLELTQKYFKKLPSYSLSELCKFFHIPLKNHHRALDDAKGSMQIYKICSQLKPRNFQRSEFLKQFEEIVEKSDETPGVIIIKNSRDNVIFQKASDNLKKDLQEKLKNESTNDPKNLSDFKIETIECASLTEAFIKLNDFKLKKKWILYLVENKSGEKFIKVGSFKRGRNIIQTFESESLALKQLNLIRSKIRNRNLPVGKDKLSVLKRNQALEDQVKLLKPDIFNLLIQSKESLNGFFTGYVFNEDRYWCEFKTEKAVKNPEDLLNLDLKFRPLKGRDRFSIEDALRVIRHQSIKTDTVRKLSKNFVSELINSQF